MRNSIDKLNLRMRRPLLPTEEADHAVDVDGQERLRGYQR